MNGGQKIGGSEDMYLEIANMFPKADLWVLSISEDAKERVPRDGRILRESWAKYLPWVKNRALLAISSLLIFRVLSLRKYDLVISSSHTFAHHARFLALSSSKTQYISYVYTPARALWEPEIDNRLEGNSGRVRFLSQLLRVHDRIRANKLSQVATISTETQSRIDKHWGQSATVIHPFCEYDEISAFRNSRSSKSNLPFAEKSYLVTAGRLVSYKRHDFAMELARHMNIPLVVLGSGPEKKKLQNLAMQLGNKIHFEENASRDRWLDIIMGARAMIMPGIEDFGITPVESIALGTPVFAYGRGGVLDYIQDGVNGRLISELKPSMFANAIEEFSETGFEYTVEKFNRNRFKNEFMEWVRKAINDQSGDL